MQNSVRTVLDLIKIIILILMLQCASFSDEEALSFSEKFLKYRAGRYINVTYLMEEYSKICPLRYSCDVNFTSNLLYKQSTEKFPECPMCSCEPTCISFGNCCPGVHFGYVEHECKSIQKYPNEHQIKRYLVSDCPGYFSDTTKARKCETDFHPCISKDSHLMYKNRFCAECNIEVACVDWKLNVKCINFKDFEKETSIAKSLIEIKLALDKNNCTVLFEPPDGILESLGETCENKDDVNKSLIQACNITGLWKENNPDIEWACRHFIVPYKEFINIFCYICNPSKASEQYLFRSENPALVNNNNSDDKEMLEICKACNRIPESKRLGIHNNVFCYKCNKIQQNGIFAEGNVRIANISEAVNSNLFSTLSLSITFSEHNTILDDFSQFVDMNFKQIFDIARENQQPSKYKRLQFSSENQETIAKYYEEVCGNDNSCSELFVEEGKPNYRYGNPVCGKCECENQCVETFNCCPNLVFRIMPYSCMKGDNFFTLEKSFERLSSDIVQEIVGIDQSYTVIDKCMNTVDDKDLSLNCSDPNPNLDILHKIPVSSDRNITFKNIFCYQCNKKGNYSGLRLSFLVSCSTFIEHELYVSMKDLLRDIRLYCNKVTFVPTNNLKCAVKYDERKAKQATGIKYVRNKDMTPNTPREITEGLTLAINDTESITHPKIVYTKCNQTGYWLKEDGLVREICESSSSEMLYLQEYRPYNKVYKNFACFLCNPEIDKLYFNDNETVEECFQNVSGSWFTPNEQLDILCNMTEVNRRWLPYKNLYCSECNQPPWQKINVIPHISIWLPAVPLIYIFSLSVEDFEHLDYIEETEIIPECDGGTYDHTLKRCRNLYCKDGRQLLNSSCSPVLKSASYREYEISIFLQPATSDFSNNTEINEDSPKVVSLLNLCSSILNDILVEFSDGTEHFILEELCIPSAPCLFFIDETTTGPFFDLARTEQITARFKILIVYSDDILTVEAALVHALNRNFTLNVTAGNISVLEVLTSRTFHDNEGGQFMPMFCVHVTGFYDSMILSKLSDRDFFYPQIKVDRFLLCAYVRLDLNDICLSPNTSDITVKNTNVTFTTEEYQREGNETIKICVNEFEKKTYQPSMIEMVPFTPEVKKALIIFSLACTILSLTCLVLTFVTYCVLSPLRTVPGKNIMVLCLYLFFSQALLQFGLNQDNQEIACVVIGACIHLFTLGSFCVMNVCSFHTFLTFCHFQFSVKHFKHHMFVKYLIYEISVPLFFVGTTMCVSLLRSKGVDFGYGKFYCFISDFYLFLFTFVAPVCLIIISNIVFFSLAFHKIRTSPKIRSTKERNNFFICLKLFALIGITWPLMIVDNILKNTWFSFFVSGLNSLQGAFILFSFAINKNVVGMIISTLMKKLGGKETATGNVGFQGRSKT